MTMYDIVCLVNKKADTQIKQGANDKPKFIKPTISIPNELEGFIDERKNSPQHAGSLSSYIRSLIIADRAGNAGHMSLKLIVAMTITFLALAVIVFLGGVVVGFLGFKITLAICLFSIGAFYLIATLRTNVRKL